MEDNLKKYLDEVKKLPSLSRTQEISCIKKAQNGDLEARNLVLCTNLRWLPNWVLPYVEEGIDLFDLIQEAVFVVLDAIDEFDTMKTNRFQNYLYWQIRRKMLSYVRNNSLFYQPGLNWDLKDKVIKLQDAYGLTKEDIKDSLNINRSQWNLLNQEFVSLEQLEDYPELNSSIERVENKVFYEQMKKYVEEAMQNLPERDQKMLFLRYFKENYNMPYREVGEEFHVTHARCYEKVKQIHARLSWKKNLQELYKDL